MLWAAYVHRYQAGKCHRFEVLRDGLLKALEIDDNFETEAIDERLISCDSVTENVVAALKDYEIELTLGLRARLKF